MSINAVTDLGAIWEEKADFGGTLAGLKPGESAVVQNIRVTGELRRRLLDLGLVPNTDISCVGTSPMGDPAAYLIRGAVIALRLCDSAMISVRRGEDPWA